MDVTIYTTPTCPWCQKTKEFLTQRGVLYKEVNVLDNEKAGRDIMARSGNTGVPQIEIKDNGQSTIVVGYDTAALKKALKLK
ncbi:MAG TPA: glutaredoxin family protein [Candidatus Nanoarchaeia archaeon]|nr:glutaredoxin family protein [Candidatus Nanoarchaeia archaeon]